MFLARAIKRDLQQLLVARPKLGLVRMPPSFHEQHRRAVFVFRNVVVDGFVEIAVVIACLKAKCPGQIA